MNVSFSVVVPLYNKEREVARAVRSALGQTLPPCEIVVVDDGSTDGGASVVGALCAGEGRGLVRLVRQANGGVCAARNRGIAEARGTHIALLDADDAWRPGFLAEIASLVADYPHCGLYCTGFDIRSDGEAIHPAPTPAERGVVADFFAASIHRYVAIPSAAVVPRRVFDTVGGFPAGMKLGEDQWMWIRIADRYPICFSPAREAVYSREASNRSASIYTPEPTRHSFEKLYDPEGPAARNEYVARAALARALTISAKGGTAEAARAARFFAYTRRYRTTLWKIRLLNRLPASWRQPLLALYNRAAWRIAKKGL